MIWLMKQEGAYCRPKRTCDIDGTLVCFVNIRKDHHNGMLKILDIRMQLTKMIHGMRNHAILFQCDFLHYR